MCNEVNTFDFDGTWQMPEIQQTNNLGLKRLSGVPAKLSSSGERHGKRFEVLPEPSGTPRKPTHPWRRCFSFWGGGAWWGGGGWGMIGRKVGRDLFWRGTILGVTRDPQGLFWGAAAATKDICWRVLGCD